VGLTDRDYMRAERGPISAPLGEEIDPHLAAARTRFRRRSRTRWAVTAFAAFFVLFALGLAVALVLRVAHAL
jgi:hypothetical protein